MSETGMMDYRWLSRWNLRGRGTSTFAVPCHDVMLFGEPRTIATNGHVLFILPNGHGVVSDTDGTHAEKLKHLTSKWPGSAPHELDLRALKAVVGVGKAWDAPCEQCGDSGKIGCKKCRGSGLVDCRCGCGDEHDATCSECSGTLTQPCDACGEAYPTSGYARIRMFDGGYFNASLLASALQYLPDEGVTLFNQDSQDGPALFTHAQWMLLVMPVRPESAFGNRAPLTFPAAA